MSNDLAGLAAWEAGVVPEPGRGEKEWIATYPTNTAFYPLAPRPEDVHLEDIAHHLSMLCRYAGGVSRFYSIAEHCVHVSFLAGVLACAKSCEPEHWLMVRRWGLLHDAAEAYLNDITRPVKKQAALAGYRTAEANLARVIAKRFGLPEEEPAEVEQADKMILADEVHELKRPVHPDWGRCSPLGKLEPTGTRIHGWLPEEAKARFIYRFRSLFEGRP